MDEAPAARSSRPSGQGGAWGRGRGAATTDPNAGGPAARTPPEDSAPEDRRRSGRGRGHAAAASDGGSGSLGIYSPPSVAGGAPEARATRGRGTTTRGGRSGAAGHARPPPPPPADGGKGSRNSQSGGTRPRVDHAESSSEEATDSEDPIKKPPTRTPDNVWTPVVFHCPLPDCPPDTVPVTNPYHALNHLRDDHRLAIVSPEQVMPFLDRYINAWAVRIAERGVTGCGFSSSSSEGGVLHMMDPDANSEDKAIRNDLQRVKLNEMLARQERERVEDAMHPRNCLFCKHVLENRHELFKHMFNEHSFNIGLPDNLVEINEFLDLVSAKLTSLQCIYCEKLFKSSAVLRKHMRKKKHFKINPRNQGYDRFYIINYLEPGKNWESYQNEQYESDEDKDGNEWEDWKDASDADRTMCLFDENVFDTVADAVAHLNFAHGFDLKQIRAAAGLDFYGVIRLINFIRQKAAHGACHHCGQAFETMEGLAAHYVSTDHARMIPQPSDSLWSDPMYLFPTYDDDPLLTWDNEEEGLKDDVAWLVLTWSGLRT